MKPTAYVINLDRRTDRWIQAQRLWSTWFDLVRVPAIVGGAMGCTMSHAYTVEQYGGRYELTIVLEDDAVPTDWFEKIGMRCLAGAYQYIDCWAVCNGGPFTDLGRDSSTVQMPRAKLTPTSSPYWSCSDFTLQTHFMLYNLRSRELLREALTQSLPLDVFLGRQAGQWVPIRLLATQAEGPSDIGQSPKNQSHYYGLSERLLEQHTPQLP